MSETKEPSPLLAVRSNDGLGLLDRINAHLRQLAPHQKERDGVVLLTEARDELKICHEALKMAYCKTKGADSTHGLDCDTDYREWLSSVSPNVKVRGCAISESEKE